MPCPSGFFDPGYSIKHQSRYSWEPAAGSGKSLKSVNLGTWCLSSWANLNSWELKGRLERQKKRQRNLRAGVWYMFFEWGWDKKRWGWPPANSQTLKLTGVLSATFTFFKGLDSYNLIELKVHIQSLQNAALISASRRLSSGRLHLDSDHRSFEKINRYCFKLLNWWQFIMQQQEVTTSWKEGRGSKSIQPANFLPFLYGWRYVDLCLSI